MLGDGRIIYEFDIHVAGAVTDHENSAALKHATFVEGVHEVIKSIEAQMPYTSEETTAVANAVQAVRVEMRLPKSVFDHYWDEYLFFDEAMLFGSEFIEVVSAMIDDNGDRAIALVHLRETESAFDEEPPVFFFDRQTQLEKFREWIGNGHNYRWPDRFVCASEMGSWCIYCETLADIAILAVRSDFSTPAKAKICELLAAASINSATAREGWSSVPFVRFSPMFRAELVMNYSSPNDMILETTTMQDDVTMWLDRRAIVSIARLMLSGGLSLIEGVRRVDSLMQPTYTKVFDRYSALWELEQKTRAYPIGDSRKLWSSEFLEREDRLAAGYLVMQHSRILDCCTSLVREFSD